MKTDEIRKAKYLQQSQHLKQHLNSKALYLACIYCNSLTKDQSEEFKKFWDWI